MSVNILRAVTVAAAACALTGCASIFGEATQTVPITSNPSEAAITIIDESGNEVFKGSTPASVTLQKSNGSYWGGKNFTVTVAKPGYKTQTIPVKSSPNGWYLAGNFFFGGLVGWFLIDPHNGQMYTLSPNAVNAGLPSTTAHNNTATDGSIRVMLVEDVPAHLRSQMVALNPSASTDR